MDDNSSGQDGDGSPPLSGIIYPGQNDVKFGRGGDTNYHIGNSRFRYFVKQYKQRYQAASREERQSVVREIVHAWRNQDPPGRFVTRTNPSAEKERCIWHDVGNEMAFKKTIKVLGEGLGGKRGKAGGSPPAPAPSKKRRSTTNTITPVPAPLSGMFGLTNSAVSFGQSNTAAGLSATTTAAAGGAFMSSSNQSPSPWGAQSQRAGSQNTVQDALAYATTAPVGQSNTAAGHTVQDALAYVTTAPAGQSNTAAGLEDAFLMSSSNQAPSPWGAQLQRARNQNTVQVASQFLDALRATAAPASLQPGPTSVSSLPPSPPGMIPIAAALTDVFDGSSTSSDTGESDD